MADLNELFENGGQLLTFSAAENCYGFYILDVADIIEIPELTKIPTAPDFVLGLMNHRGKAVPVMDLRLRLGLPEGEFDERSCIIVLEINTLQCGLRVDRVLDAELIRPEDITRSPVENGMVKGFVIRDGKERISILDPEILVRT
ncbi:MAG: chemotaxis protein CheW [Ruminococcus sp.]|nr:chemotaxis protein CheW [Ruminococcus sp.]MBP3798142.1 chemotaxis protein CheW [Ruminococcus sp.]